MKLIDEHEDLDVGNPEFRDDGAYFIGLSPHPEKLASPKGDLSNPYF